MALVITTFLLAPGLSMRLAAQSPVPPFRPTQALTIPRVGVPPTLEDYLDGAPRPDGFG